MSLVNIDLPGAVLLAMTGALGGWFLWGNRLRRVRARTLAPPQNHWSVDDHTASQLLDEFANTAGDAKGADRMGPCDRATFFLALGHRLVESARSGDPLSVVVVQIDDSQTLYDRHGPAAAGTLLQAAARFFVASVRGMDWVASFNPTTFAFLLPGARLADALGVAERLRTTLSACNLCLDGNRVSLTLSAGTAEATAGDYVESLLRRAEQAMNAAIRAGGDCSYFYTRQQHEPAPREMCPA